MGLQGEDEREKCRPQHTLLSFLNFTILMPVHVLVLTAHTRLFASLFDEVNEER